MPGSSFKLLLAAGQKINQPIWIGGWPNDPAGYAQALAKVAAWNHDPENTHGNWTSPEEWNARPRRWGGEWVIIYTADSNEWGEIHP